MFLVLGANGQLGRAFINKPGYKGLLKKDVDARDFKRLSYFLNYYDPQIIINCAALTDVDYCQTNPSESYRTNVEVVDNLVEECQERSIKLIHFSSDYVFHVNDRIPIKVGTRPKPYSLYGLHKQLSEDIILNSDLDYLIIRTSMLYGPSGRNFVNWVIQENQPKCVIDHITKITNVNTMVKAVEALIEDNATGIYHVADKEEITPFRVACFIKEQVGGIEPVPVLAEMLNRPAKRPKYSVLDTTKIEEIVTLPHWKESLSEYLRSYKSN